MKQIFNWKLLSNKSGSKLIQLKMKTTLFFMLLSVLKMPANENFEI
ncbi:MAG: hypothetical protein IZT56_10655 [Bacteroidetes bacterium]|nr:hypothetical protein [Bacteroidota bacterium]